MTPAPRQPFPLRAVVGIALMGVLGLLDCLSLIGSRPPGEEVGPPVDILVLDTVLGVATVAAVVVALTTRSRGAVRVAAGTRILSVVTVVPAFFAGVAPVVVMIAAAAVLVNVVAVVLALAPSRRPATVSVEG
ncbi:hypothetical protein IF650_04200 [Cellulosimicrobium terreum]|nr:hypothetical protein [Cellulosimicrobium terreum]